VENTYFVGLDEDYFPMSSEDREGIYFNGKIPEINMNFFSSRANLLSMGLFNLALLVKKCIKHLGSDHALHPAAPFCCS
jgi:hypothetical protein